MVYAVYTTNYDLRLAVARLIALANQKGGVGKTTTAVNLAACLALADQRTLLVDLDPQGNATSGLGLDKQAVNGSVYDALIGRRSAADVLAPTRLEHLRILPANIELVGAQIELVNLEQREYKLQQALAPLRDQFDFILIDSPPSLGLLTLNALTAAQSVLIPIQAEYYALEGISALLETIDLARAHLNPTLAIEGILLTMYDSRTRLCAQVAREVRQHFTHQVYETVIPRNVRLSEAPSFGKPIALYDVHSAGAKAYINLTKEILHGRTQSTG